MTRHLTRNALHLSLLACLLLFLTGCNMQRAYPTPDAALDSLISALQADDHDQLRDILGWSGEKMLNSGDPVADQLSREKFLEAYQQKHVLIPEENGDMTLTVGDNDWPLPVPLVKEKKGWYWDSAAGKEEIISRRVGRNELYTIQTCLAVVDAQRDYAEMDPEHRGVPVYAEKFLSDPGHKNGLYWKTAEGEPDSPLGQLAAEAEEQGYLFIPTGKPQPFHGYYFRMLLSQGKDAPGGERDYKVGDLMLWGFAVVAYPVEYGKSGVMSFIVNQDGTLYQKDLGDFTDWTASHMKDFNPGPGWTKVESANDAPTTATAPTTNK